MRPTSRSRSTGASASPASRSPRPVPAGVKIAFGTDAGVSKHGRNADEFELMVKYGMPPVEAIKAATVNAADLLGLSSEVGTIEAGKSGRHHRGCGRSAGRRDGAEARRLRHGARRGGQGRRERMIAPRAWVCAALAALLVAAAPAPADFRRRRALDRSAGQRQLRLSRALSRAAHADDRHAARRGGQGVEREANWSALRSARWPCSPIITRSPAPRSRTAGRCSQAMATCGSSGAARIT